MVGANSTIQKFLEDLGSTGLKTAASLAELIRRPELSYEALEPIDEGRTKLPDAVIEQINITIKYQGYIDLSLIHIYLFYMHLLFPVCPVSVRL